MNSVATSLKYGNSTLEFNLPSRAEKLITREPTFEIAKSEFTETLNSFLPSDTELYKKIAIVVSDKTRLCSYPEYLPWLTEALEGKGALNSDITFYIAYGTHLKQSEEESISTYGNVYKKYNFVHHDCFDEAALLLVGVSSRGTEVKVCREVLESSIIITFGAISHHYFAGYGGGRKLLFPGLAGRKAVYTNHSYFLDREKGKLAEGCQQGNLNGNPIAEDLEEIDCMMPQKISIHGILNSKGEVSRLMIGARYEHFIDACKMHDSYYRSGTGKQYDLVIASSGGYPKDINFIQGHKSVHHSAAFVKDGGNLIVLSECSEGIGSNYFTKFLEAGSFGKAFSILEKNYEGNGGTALSMMTKTSRINIHMLTSLSHAECELLKVRKLNPADIQHLIDKEFGSIALIQNASLLVK